MSVCIGLDAHHRTCTYKAKDEDGRLIGEETIPSTREALVDLAGRYPGATIVVEASSVHEWIHDVLREHGVGVVVAHPLNVRRTLGKGRKNDSLDAGFLVDMHRLGVLPRSWVASVEIRALRSLTRRRAYLVHQRTRYMNRIHSILKRRGVHVLREDADDEVDEVDDVFALKRRDTLRRLQDPEVDMMLRLVDDLTRELKASTAEVEQAALAEPSVRLLRSIPGFGALTALSVFAEIGDVDRFPDADHVAAYFGLVPGEESSGGGVKPLHITKRGSNLARWLLGQAAWTHVRTCPGSSVSKAYRRLSKKGKKKAIVMVARKLAKVSWHVLKEKREFTLNG